MPFPLLLALAAPVCIAHDPALVQAPDTAVSTSSTRPAGGTLLKLGTGLTRGFEVNGYSISVPLVVGAERHLTPALSVYANGFAGLRLGRFHRPTTDWNRFVGPFGAEAGIRYYYNQEKRRRLGRATGPFVGNYLALTSASTFYHSRYYGMQYDYSTLKVVWGMQRRLGQHGLLDAYTGLGINNDATYRLNVDGTVSRSRRPRFAPELGIRLSLIP